MTDNTSKPSGQQGLSTNLRSVAEQALHVDGGESSDPRTSEALFVLFSALGGRFDQQHERERAELLASIRR